jgi:glyoxylase-like metal-dependent hydrolase (beta-lactamase superfamily II)
MKENKITVPELQEILNEDKRVFILDVRPEEEREEWYIPESHHIDVYEELKDGREDVFDDKDLPHNIPVVTICDAGKTSQTAADILAGKGYQVYSLEGGMKAWNFAWNTAELSLHDSGLKIIQVRRTAKGCLSYLAGSDDEAIVVDASLDPEIYLNIARDNGWKIRYVMDTHIHADYLSRTRELAAQSEADLLFLESAEAEYSYMPLRDGQKLSFGNAEFEVQHRPGHTPESTCYFIDNRVLLTGDTLFTDGVGRPDLKASKEEGLQKAGRLYDSLQRILGLPENTIILPAHISQSVPFDGNMIYAELHVLKNRLEMLNYQKEPFKEAIMKKIPPPPSNYSTIVQLNKRGEFRRTSTG